MVSLLGSLPKKVTLIYVVVDDEIALGLVRTSEKLCRARLTAQDFLKPSWLFLKTQIKFANVTPVTDALH